MATASLAIWGGVQTARLHHAQAETQDVRNAMVLERANATAAMLKQAQDFRVEEARRTAAQQEKIDAAEKIAQKARADAAIADAAAGRLSQRIASLVAAAREAASNPAPVVAGAPATDPAGMFADVLGRCVARVQLLARIADERGTAGQLCESSYDALTPPDKPQE